MTWFVVLMLSAALLAPAGSCWAASPAAAAGAGSRASA
jgi:hypothetical protein